MVSLVPMGNGIYNRDGVVVDYNGRQGKHPKECNCVGHINKTAGQMNPPQMITQGVSTMANQPALTFDQWQQQQAYNAYVASQNNAPVVNNPLPIEQTPVAPTPNVVVAPVATPIAPTFVEGQNEYVIPINVTMPKKGMAQITDARVHVEPKFTDGIHDFRFAKGYASRSIVSTGKWALKLVRVE